MRPISRALGLALTLLAGVVSAQQDPPEVRQAVAEVQQVEFDRLLVASPDVRSIVVASELDQNHDQYLSEDEVEAVLRQAERSAESARRASQLTNHRQGSWIYNSPPLAVGPYADYSSYRWLGGGRYIFSGPYVYIIPTASPPPPISSSAASRRVTNLRLANQELAAAGRYELSLVDEEFHRLFADLPGEQRSALVAADADGNNDGMVTVPEFHDYNKRLFSRMPRFEKDFGEEAYLEVLRLFGVIW